MNGVRIEYGDYAIGAREDFTASAYPTADMFVDANQVLEDISFPTYRDASENYSVALDGNSLPFPSDPFGANLGWWGGTLSNDVGEFDTPQTLVLESEHAHASPGFTFVFDVSGNVYPTEIAIVWLGANGAFLKDQSFYPDSATYFCESKVEYFSRVEVTFYKLNMPNARLKLYSVQFGRGATFSGRELKSARVSQVLDPISSELAISTTDFVIDDKRAIDYTFQARQKIKTFFNNELISTTFVKNAKRKSKTAWDVQTEDYIGIMDGVSFPGGIYENESARVLLKQIFDTAKVPYNMDTLEDASVSGYIPYTTCRIALMQVLFAIQAVADTSYVDAETEKNYADVVKVYTLTDDESESIDGKRIMQGQSFNEGTRVTEVSVTAHAFVKPKEELAEELVVYDGSVSGASTRVLVIFPEPLYDVNVRYGGIYEHGANYAIISATNLCVLTGKKYKHLRSVKSKPNPLVLGTDTKNVKSITEATLVSSSNIDNVLEKCYNWLVRTNKLSTRIAERKHDARVGLGDKITVPTEYGGGYESIDGRVVKSSFGLNGSILIKDVEVV